jgi:hypothetical protein
MRGFLHDMWPGSWGKGHEYPLNIIEGLPLLISAIRGPVNAVSSDSSPRRSSIEVDISGEGPNSTLEWTAQWKFQMK